jgi:hypothetical protein
MAAKHTQRAKASEPLRHGHATHRDAIWAAMRELREFDNSDIEHAVNGVRPTAGAVNTNRVSPDTIRTYATGLHAAGYLELIGSGFSTTNGRQLPNRWKLVNDVGIDAPRVTRDGKEVTQGKGRENMWKAMKILKSFNWRELQAHASTSEHPIKDEEVKDYIKHLYKARYLILTQPSKPGTPAHYRLLPSRYTGPKSPMIQKVKQVYDPNLCKVVWPEQGGDQ